MIRKIILAVTVCALMFCSTGVSMAHTPGEPITPPQFGPGSGAEAIFQGQPVTVQGLVAAVGGFGQGIQIDTGNGIVQVFGLGPVWYWETEGATFPTVGEPITIHGYQVTMADNTTRLIATSATMYGQTIELRDGQTGIPAWRQAAWRLWSGQALPGQTGQQQSGRAGLDQGCYPGHGPAMMGPGGYFGRGRGFGGPQQGFGGSSFNNPPLQ